VIVYPYKHIYIYHQKKHTQSSPNAEDCVFGRAAEAEPGAQGVFIAAVFVAEALPQFGMVLVGRLQLGLLATFRMAETMATRPGPGWHISNDDWLVVNNGYYMLNIRLIYMLNIWLIYA